MKTVSDASPCRAISEDDENAQEPHVCFLVPRHEQHRVNFAEGFLIVGEAECLTEEILRPQSPISFRR